LHWPGDGEGVLAVLASDATVEVLGADPQLLLTLGAIHLQI
jgi:hypothetical protein